MAPPTPLQWARHWVSPKAQYLDSPDSIERNGARLGDLARQMRSSCGDGAIGEGWHNYHHRYPTDYATSEFGMLYQWNPSKVFIDIMAAIGQAYDLKRSTTAAATRERLAIAVEEEVVKGLVVPMPLTPLEQALRWAVQTFKSALVK
ncbi:hypothetical protein H310_14684 [Aphanomyces invadans]|uniref:Fatty acid desaturase domain-containing protein n=1 Tax=Aphanomyces invadans TaxID=157072 RepID=A0A024T991_9STRA|nr:hypothetical protein H310_14684 [Aphanomyces invadans]ETV90559.1 hypothetical protein H310_14684 [Aphanomyces invadans]|eukprot:XP_008880809.1 hypothetical protein H310_14684 [Aphanomyces invadans]